MAEGRKLGSLFRASVTKSRQSLLMVGEKFVTGAVRMSVAVSLRVRQEVEDLNWKAKKGVHPMVTCIISEVACFALTPSDKDMHMRHGQCTWKAGCGKGYAQDRIKQ